VLGVHKNEVILTEYDEDWANQFQITKIEVEAILGDNILGIHHIGSTAIKGIVAKPILDVAVTVKSIEQLNVSGMESVGYVYCSNRFVPEDYLFMKYTDEYRNVCTHHIHCYLEGHENLKAVILFCKYLNTHPETAGQYNDLKQKLAYIYSNDRIAYTEGKADFINKIVSLAKDELRTK